MLICRGVPDIRRISVYADIRNKIGLKTDIRYPRISNPGQNGYPLSANIKSVDITDIRYPRISNPWTKRISVSNGYPFQIRGYPADVRGFFGGFFGH